MTVKPLYLWVSSSLQTVRVRDRSQAGNRVAGTVCVCVHSECFRPTSHYEVGVGEKVLCLHESASVAGVEEVEDAICVNSDWPVH